MKAGYTIEHLSETDMIGLRHDTAIINNYHGLNNVELVYSHSSRDYGMEFSKPKVPYTVAIFRIVKCDDCGKVAKLKEQSCGDRICQSCEDNRNEAAAERYANDAENFPTNDYSHLKRLK